MRFLNMRDLSHVRRARFANHISIGKGTFASVFAASDDSASVVKITTDRYSYSLLTDQVWHVMREHVEDSFPRVIEDHGEVGESRGLTAFLVEVERLHPVSTTEHRRRIARWIKEFTDFSRSKDRDAFGSRAQGGMAAYYTRRSIEFCQHKSNDLTDPYREVFGALYEFLRNYGGALDLRPANFMCRADGTLVWNDCVFDAVTFTSIPYH
jgi:hypothetical protein